MEDISVESVHDAGVPHISITTVLSVGYHIVAIAATHGIRSHQLHFRGDLHAVDSETYYPDFFLIIIGVSPGVFLVNEQNTIVEARYHKTEIVVSVAIAHCDDGT